MEATLSHLYFSVILLFTFYLCLERCKADEVRPFKKPCGQAIDCGTSHVIAIVDVVQDKRLRVSAKNKCNGQHKCQLHTNKTNCSINYYCIDDRFLENCSVMNAPRNIGNSSDVFWCYQSNQQEKGKPYCWEFSKDVYHHWVILRGWMKIKTEPDLDGTSMTNFKLTTRTNKSEVCTSSKYIWIIYVGTTSPKTPVNIYSKDDPTLTDSDQVTVINKNSSEEVIKFERNNNMTEYFQTDLFVGDNKNQDNNSNMSFLKIIVMISAIGGVLIVLAITIAILWFCCRRCNKVTINKSVTDSRKNSHNVKDVEPEEPNCQMREGFVPTVAKRDTGDSIGFWTDDEDYDPDDDRHSKVKPNIYAVGNCIYEHQSSKNEIYMNSVIPPPSCPEKEKEMYVNMNTNPVNNHFVFL